MTAVASETIDSPRSLLYSPLDHTRLQIRLIKILPCDYDKEQVSCQLEIVELSRDTRYAALSYIWGDPHITKDIKVNGINLPVTTNLASALRYFRKFGFPQNKRTKDVEYLWADAICINQDERAITEKNHQVALMSKIYSSATSVLSWLGAPDDDHLDTALRVIHDIAPVIGVTADPSDIEISDEVVYAGFRWLDSNVRSVVDAENEPIEWASLRALRENIYWERIWIIQEVVLAKSPWDHWFICGDTSATFQELKTFNNVLISIGETPFPEPDGDQSPSSERDSWNIISKISSYYALRIKIINHLKGQSQKAPEITPMPLYTIACVVAYSCSTSRPHDFVYGMLGIFPDSNIEPDYGRTVREVYINALLSAATVDWDYYLLVAGRGFGVMNYHNLPSWVPDLTRLRRKGAGFVDTRLKQTPLLGNRLTSQPRVLEDDTLCIDGVVCDHVELVKRLNLSPDDRDHNSKAILQLCVDYLHDFYGTDEAISMSKERQPEWKPGRIASKIPGKRPLKALLDVLDWKLRDSRIRSCKYWGFSGPELSPVAWYFMIRLRFPNKLTQAEQNDAIARLEIPGEMELGHYLQSCFANASLNRDDMDSYPTTAVTLDIGDFEDILFSVSNTSLFKTKTGYLGIGPPGIEPGDVVCGLNPCSLPILLREASTPHGESYMEHIGPSYVLGISDGEMADAAEIGGFKTRTFSIR